MSFLLIYLSIKKVYTCVWTIRKYYCETHVCQLLLSIYKTHLLHVAGFGSRRSFNIKL